jgi:hypothetical protein
VDTYIDADGNGFIEDPVPDEDPIETVAMLDGKWPTDQRVQRGRRTTLRSA